MITSEELARWKAETAADLQSIAVGPGLTVGMQKERLERLQTHHGPHGPECCFCDGEPNPEPHELGDS